MAKILICAGARGWSCQRVIQGITPHIEDHEIEICYYWIGGYDPADWDLIYIHSGAVVNGPAKNYIREHRNDTKWVVGIRGPTAYKRNFHTLSPELWDGYASGCEWYKEQCRGDELVPGYVCHGSVDAKLFNPMPLPEEFTIGWAGQAANGTKRFRRFLELPFKKRVATRGTGYMRKVFDYEGKGYQYHEMPDFFRDISVYVNVSFREGGPLPPKEAALCGRPAVITRTGDGPEWIPEEYVFDNKKKWFDREGMIEMIEKLKYDRKLLEREGVSFIERAKRFDHSIIAKEYQIMIDGVLE